MKRVPADLAGFLSRTVVAASLCLCVATACGSEKMQQVAITNGATTDANDAAPTRATNGAKDHPELPPVGFASLLAAQTPMAVGPYFSLVSRPMPTSCVDIHDATKSTAYAQIYPCNNSAPQYFSLSIEGRLVLYERSEGSNIALCLQGAAPTGASDANDTNGTIFIATCAGSENVTWKQQGHQWLNVDLGLCLTTPVVTDPNQSLALALCDANDVYQMWAAGNANSLLQQAAATNANISVADMCAGRVFVANYDPNDAGAARIVSRYGSLDAMTTYLQKAKQENCAVMFQRGGDARFYSDLIVEFDNPPGAAPMATAGGIRRVFVSTPYWATVDESDQPFTLRIDTTFHHEFAHALHDVPHVPGGFVEGYANWVPFRAGYLRASEKKRGGNWPDGYSTTSFFMVWLDDQPTTHPVGARFTDRMRAQSALNVNNPNWFVPWFTQTMGADPNQMWTRYQASF